MARHRRGKGYRMSRTQFWVGMAIIAGYVVWLIHSHPDCPAGSVAYWGSLSGWKCLVTVAP